MSCLRHVSRKSTGRLTQEQSTGAKDSVQVTDQELGLSSADNSERVWSVSDLSILHELQKPIVVVVPGLYRSPTRSGRPHIVLCCLGMSC